VSRLPDPPTLAPQERPRTSARSIMGVVAGLGFLGSMLVQAYVYDVHEARLVLGVGVVLGPVLAITALVAERCGRRHAGEDGR
jgi:hypothetical protein